MGKTFNSGKVVAKLATFTVGCIPASIRGVDMGIEKVAPNFHKELNDSSWGSLALGDSKAHDFTLNSTVDFFSSSNEVTLTATEIKAIEVIARSTADATGLNYDMILSGLLDTKKAEKSSK